MKQLLITSIPSNTPPYGVYVCDFFGNNCQFAAAINTTVPPSYAINLPPQFEAAPAVMVKIYNGVSCVSEQIYYCGTANSDKICECDSFFNQNIYIFYDATTLDPATASGASISFRTWYTGVTANSGFTGNLYEMVIGKNNNNGENWMWWSTYPYLGSLTGGTLSDGHEVKIFGYEPTDTVVGTEYKSSFCQPTPTTACRPKLVSFNDNAGEPIYQKINRGQDFISGSSLSGTGIMGVPFDHNDLTGLDTGIYGTFSGGDTNYFSICLLDEADGLVGMYTSAGSQTGNTLTENFFRLRGSVNPLDAFSGSSTTAPFEPSTRFQADYENFLKVWGDIKLTGGTFNGLIYPVIGNNTTGGFNFLHHVIGAVEGEGNTAFYFSNKYNRNGQTWPNINPTLNSINPTVFTLKGLETINFYSALTNSNAYVNLNSQYKNGSGLKNFGWFADPTVSAFTGSIVGETLDGLIQRSSAGTNCEYIVTNPDLQLNKIYYFNTESVNGIKGCYQVVEKNIITFTNFVSPPLLGGYDYCFECGGLILANLNNNLRNASLINFGFNNGNVDYINEMWTSSTFYSVINYQGVKLTRYPGGTNGTYWDWQNSSYASTTEYPNIPSQFIGVTTIPGMDLNFKISAFTANGINNVWQLNDYFRGVQDQMDYLFSAQTLFGPLNYIEIGQEYYLRPGSYLAPDINGFVARFPTSSGAPYSQYAVEKVEWIYSAKTNFPSAKIAICGSEKQNDGYPGSRVNTWNDRLMQVFLSPTFNPTSIYPDAITIHSYFFTKPTDFANIDSWVINSVNMEYDSLVVTINDFMSVWGGTSSIEFWITEFGLTDPYSQISGSWAHGLYLISIVFKMLEINEITMMINNSLSSGRQYGMLFDHANIFGGPNTADVFDLSAGGLTLGIFNRTFNDTITLDTLNFDNALNGLYGIVCTGMSSNYLLYTNTTNTTIRVDFSNVLLGYTVNYFVTYDALPSLYVNKKDPITSLKDYPNITSGNSISNSIEVVPFSLTYIEFS